MRFLSCWQIWNFTGVCHTGADRRSLRSRCEANTSVRTSQQHFASPSFKECMPSGSLFWCVHLLLGRGYTHSSLTSRGDAPRNTLPPSTHSFISGNLWFKEHSYRQKTQAAVIGWALPYPLAQEKRIHSLKWDKWSSWEMASSDAELHMEVPLDMGPYCLAKGRQK